MIILGVCGRTGSGKTTVCSLLDQHGWACLDPDRVARDVVKKGQPCLQELTVQFGTDILRGCGALNRKRLGNIAFTSKENQLALNAITHKYIMESVKVWLKKQEKRGVAVAVIDAPLLFESGANALCHKTLVVISSTDHSRARIESRDKITSDTADARLRHQKSNEELLSLCDYAIENHGTLEELKESVRSFIETFEGEMK